MINECLIITGAAATGKTTLGNHLRGDPKLMVLDGDVLAAGAAAVSHNKDYVAFWRYLLTIAAEVRSNGLVPLFTCICLPEQVLAAVTDETIHFLILISEEATIRHRIANRLGHSPVPSTATHVEIDKALRYASVPPPHTAYSHDVAISSLTDSVAAARQWSADKLQPNPGPIELEPSRCRFPVWIPPWQRADCNDGTWTSRRSHSKPAT